MWRCLLIWTIQPVGGSGFRCGSGYFWNFEMISLFKLYNKSIKNALNIFYIIPSEGRIRIRLFSESRIRWKMCGFSPQQNTHIIADIIAEYHKKSSSGRQWHASATGKFNVTLLSFLSHYFYTLSMVLILYGYSEIGAHVRLFDLSKTLIW